MEEGRAEIISTFRTKSEFKDACFYWTIDNWEQITRYHNGSLVSPTFSLKGTDVPFSLRLDLDINGPAFYLEMGKLDVIKPSEKWYMIKDDDKKELIADVGCFRIPSPADEREDINSLANSFLNNGALIICCDITYVSSRHVNLDLIQEVNTEDKIYKNKLCFKSHGKLYQDQKLCDVTFLLANKDQVRAHSAFLGAASPYFTAMFVHDSKGRSESYTVDLTEDPDASPEIFRGFLDCIYGLKSVFDLQNIAIELCILADKYAVSKLQDACESYLCDMMDESNISKILLFSHNYNCNFLKERALKYARARKEVVKGSYEFEEMCKHKDLMFELM